MKDFILFIFLFCGCAHDPIVHGIPNFRQVAPGVYRGGQPTAEGWQYLKTIAKWDVKLNTGDDELARSAGLQVIHLPITFIQQTIGKPERSTLKSAVSAITDCETYGVFVHCTHGQDRTGLVVGAWRVSQHWSKVQAYAEMVANGFHPILRGLYWSWEEDVP